MLLALFVFTFAAVICTAFSTSRRFNTGDRVVFANHGHVATGIVDRSRTVMIPGDGPVFCYYVRFDGPAQPPTLINATDHAAWIPPKFLKRCPK